MKTLRTTSLCFAVIASGLALLGAATTASAAPGAAMKPGAGKQTGGSMAAALKLTPTQQTQIKSIQADAMKQRAAIMNNKALTTEQKKAKMQPLMVSMMKKLEAVLTPEQKKILEKKMAEGRSRMAGMQNKAGAAHAAPKP